MMQRALFHRQKKRQGGLAGSRTLADIRAHTADAASRFRCRTLCFFFFFFCFFHPSFCLFVSLSLCARLHQTCAPSSPLPLSPPLCSHRAHHHHRQAAVQPTHQSSRQPKAVTSQ
ncbi:hypothetical protein GQ42DRAFT_46598 [Ramicandelaber brevisporus]|nr:hypothetical protein GQ42DRAFT_46598 [Ramicandelaber brevisporus]